MATGSVSSSRPTSFFRDLFVLLAPTSRSARPATFRPEVEVGGRTTRVLVEQVGAVDTTRLGDLAGHLTPEELWGVDDALLTVLAVRGSPRH